MLKHIRSTEEWDEKNVAQKGFTLVELLVVIVILGILAAVVVFAVGGATDKAQQSSCEAELAALESGVEAYRASVGQYATTITQLTTGANRFLRSAPTWYTVDGGNTGGLTRTAEGVTENCPVPT